MPSRVETLRSERSSASAVSCSVNRRRNGIINHPRALIRIRISASSRTQCLVRRPRQRSASLAFGQIVIASSDLAPAFPPRFSAARDPRVVTTRVGAHDPGGQIEKMGTIIELATHHCSGTANSTRGPARWYPASASPHWTGSAGASWRKSTYRVPPTGSAPAGHPGWRPAAVQSASPSMPDSC